MVTQRALSFKKKIKLTVMNMHSKLLNNHSVHPPFSAGGDPLYKSKPILTDV